MATDWAGPAAVSVLSWSSVSTRAAGGAADVSVNDGVMPSVRSRSMSVTRKLPNDEAELWAALALAAAMPRQAASSFTKVKFFMAHPFKSGKTHAHINNISSKWAGARHRIG
ncbi:hypothetical protein FHW83_001297 [Duganella sp. SG902]|uniref:hypothetical protein n=1 Tax=Duganella sp. SG902 TaxID=2587016 RepID=UPI00159D88FC|nr:hypothetical protein [Duganella sp. SG902]